MPAPVPISVRPARRRDLPVLGRLGAGLARMHHDWDPHRFFVVDGMEEGYERWFDREREDPAAVLLAAERDGRVVGYAYGRLEPRDWNALRDRCGLLVDLMVEAGARGAGVGPRLLEAFLAAMREKGAPRVVLQTASRNRAAQRFFRAQGFRPTMVEMAIELEASPRRASRPQPPRRSGKSGGDESPRRAPGLAAPPPGGRRARPATE